MAFRGCVAKLRPHRQSKNDKKTLTRADHKLGLHPARTACVVVAELTDSAPGFCCSSYFLELRTALWHAIISFVR